MFARSYMISQIYQKSLFCHKKGTGILSRKQEETKTFDQIYKDTGLLIRTFREEEAMEIYIRNSTSGQLIKLNNIEGSSRISDLKTYIQHQVDIAPEHQLLIFSGKQLEDHQTCEDCKIQNKSLLDLVFRLVGS